MSDSLRHYGLQPGSSVHRILQARILEWVAISFSKLLLQFSSVAQSCPTLCDPMNHSTPGLPVHHQLLEPTQTHVHQVSDAIQPSHPLSSPSAPALSLSQHQGLFKWVSSSHEVAKVLEFQLQHQSFQWTPRTDTHVISISALVITVSSTTEFFSYTRINSLLVMELKQSNCIYGSTVQ